MFRAEKERERIRDLLRVKRKSGGEEEESMDKKKKEKKKRPLARPEERSRELNRKARERLKASRFRHVNQYLNSHSAREAKEYVQRDVFRAYHETMREVVKKWPVNPVEHVIKVLKGKLKTTTTRGEETVVVDCGCGDRAQIARALSDMKHVRVRSFDLVEDSSEGVERAEMSSLPLADNCADFVVYCLSLMANELQHVLMECRRVLRTGGELVIVEVSSRFDKREDLFVKQLSMMGFALTRQQHVDSSGFFTCFEFKRQEKAKNLRQEIRLKPVVYKQR